MPDIAKAVRDDNFGDVTIPFLLKNNGNKKVQLGFLMGHRLDGLMDQTGKIILRDYVRSGPSGGAEIDLNPGETVPGLFAQYRIERLTKINGVKVSGVIVAVLKGANLQVKLVSAPFLIPSALTTLPWNDLGTQTYLSVTPDLTKAGFSGGSFPVTTLESQQANPNYADWIKNGWAEDVSIPLTVGNTSSQDLVVVIDDVDFYIAGDDSFKQERLRYRHWEYAKASTPILKPGESCSSEPTGRSYITLSWLYRRGYKPGDEIIAVVGGRIPGTNNIFECYSAPFKLPPLPKGEPPANK